MSDKKTCGNRGHYTPINTKYIPDGAGECSVPVPKWAWEDDGEPYCAMTYRDVQSEDCKCCQPKKEQDAK